MNFRMKIFRHGFVPALLAAVVASFVLRAALERLLLAGSIPVDATSAVVFLVIAGLGVAERFQPANESWKYQLGTVPGWAQIFRDIFYLFIITQLSALLIGAAALGLRKLGGGFGLWPSGAPLAVRIVLAFFLVELFSYWFHRACHRVPLLWQFHSTHHVITELTGLKSLRTHPVDNVLFYVARSVPLLLLGAGPVELVAATYFGSILGILAHSNIDVADGFLGAVVNYPRFHTVHHSSALAESNANFGCHTVLWDRIFRTFRREPLAPLLLGVAPVRMRTLWQELIWPFYRRIS
jgi:sterol desaturase/sphingolipid hydroxylase (fatty acid hydroxylase superfamily)